ncbi:MAG: ABC transporter ATP-binding protein [Deltaproteobacteria bacterium]|jgi:simple sugar transport system ATP-binding protein|nr:ABC transporter ATP-binding protein [Deltaproteobacteria bacterium]
MEDFPLIRLEGISKYFGKVRANSHIDLDIRAGRIKALLGENGAGKSTLMSILAGRLEPDTGRISVEGQIRRFRSPKDAHLAGIGMVYQHFMLVDTMSVAENVLLGHEGGFMISPAQMRERVRKLAERYGLAVDPTASVGSLSMGERQRVEILKLLCRECRVLIFDEPTAVLTPVESEQLFTAMRRMAAQGKAIVFISHKLPEVLSVADEVAILRRGEVVDAFERSQVPDEAELARRMLGRSLFKEPGQAAFTGETEESGQGARDLQQVMSELPIARIRGWGGRAGRGRRIAQADSVLSLDGLSCRGAGTAGFSKVSFAIAKGQILALVGVAGNGQKELVEVICGLRRPDAGSLKLLGQDYREFFSDLPEQNGLGYIPEDRRGVASCPELSLVDNFLLTARKLFSHRGLLDRKRALRATRALIADHNIIPGNPQARGRELSGGNLQKLIVGRELLRNPRCIVAENPTQGLDVAATEEVWRRLRVARESSGILLVTGDIAEALALADYIAVIYRGKLVDLFSAANQEKVDQIGLMMAGSASAD